MINANLLKVGQTFKLTITNNAMYHMVITWLSHGDHMIIIWLSREFLQRLVYISKLHFKLQ